MPLTLYRSLPSSSYDNNVTGRPTSGVSVRANVRVCECDSVSMCVP